MLWTLLSDKTENNQEKESEKSLESDTVSVISHSITPVTETKVDHSS